jgi:hypothetical protein
MSSGDLVGFVDWMGGDGVAVVSGAVVSILVVAVHLSVVTRWAWASIGGF